MSLEKDALNMLLNIIEMICIAIAMIVNMTVTVHAHPLPFRRP